MSSIGRSLMNLSKNILGAGMLSLPLSMALVGNVHVALSVMLLSCVMNACSFVMMGACCRWTGQKSFRRVFESLYGRRFSFIIDLTIFTNSFLACVALMVLIGDFVSRSIPDFRRDLCILTVGLIVILPLCFLRSLSALAWSSLLGLIATMFSFGYVVLHAYNAHAVATPTRPVHGTHTPQVSMRWGILKSWSLFNSCFLAHYNAPRYHSELRQPTARRFAIVVSLAFSSCFLVYAIFAYAGYARFGASVNGNVFDSFTSDDVWLRVARLAMAISVSLTYPLIFAALKEASGRAMKTRWIGKVYIFIVVSVTMMLAIGFDDVSKFSALKGATSSCILSFVLPPVMYLKAQRVSQPLLTRDCVFPVWIVHSIFVLGVTLGCASLVYLVATV